MNLIINTTPSFVISADNPLLHVRYRLMCKSNEKEWKNVISHSYNKKSPIFIQLSLLSTKKKLYCNFYKYYGNKT